VSAPLCMDGHPLGPPVLYVGSGRLDGRWWVRSCTECNAGSLESIDDPGNTLAHLLDALEALGCNPEQVA
jgi:hypothetical protein